MIISFQATTKQPNRVQPQWQCFRSGPCSFLSSYFQDSHSCQFIHQDQTVLRMFWGTHLWGEDLNGGKIAAVLEVIKGSTRRQLWLVDWTKRQTQIPFGVVSRRKSSVKTLPNLPTVSKGSAKRSISKKLNSFQYFSKYKSQIWE